MQPVRWCKTSLGWGLSRLNSTDKEKSSDEINIHLSVINGRPQVGRHWFWFDLEMDEHHQVYLPNTRYAWMNASPAFNPVMSRKPVRCSASQRTYDQQLVMGLIMIHWVEISKCQSPLFSVLWSRLNWWWEYSAELYSNFKRTNRNRAKQIKNNEIKQRSCANDSRIKLNCIFWMTQHTTKFQISW